MSDDDARGALGPGNGRARAVGAAFFGLDPAATRCPHAVFGGLRAEAPVAWFDEIEAFVVTRYDDVVTVLRSPDVFSSRSATGPVAERQTRAIIAELAAEDPEIRHLLRSRAAPGRSAVLLKADPPRHTVQRKLVNRAFSPLAIRGMEDEIRAVADSLIDAFVADGRVELVGQLAVPLPMTVIAGALRVPRSKMADFKRWSDEFGRAVGNHTVTKDELAASVRAQAEFFDYFGQLVAERRQHPGDDLVSRIANARIDGEELSSGEILEMIAQFLVAGNETTTKLIAGAVLRLAATPSLADRLRAQPDLVPVFVEEAARLDPPVFGMYRVATRDAVVGGVEIPAGSTLWLVYASGNRDEARWDAAEECVLERSPDVPHLTFGLGVHLCLGAGLARAETRIALERLLARCEDIRPALPVEEVEYERSYMLRGLLRLPLTFRPAAAAQKRR